MINEIETAKSDKIRLCKCGKGAEFIKDYFVCETKQLKEGTGEDATKRTVENPCGVLRRRYCPDCFSKLAAKQRSQNKRLNAKILISVFLPLALLSVLNFISYFMLGKKDTPTIVTAVAFAFFTVIATASLAVIFGSAQSGRKKIEKGDFTHIKAVDALMDSLNFGLEDSKKIKEMSSLDIVVDGNGRVNYDMERSGFNMRVEYDGKISLEPMRRRILYPFDGEAEFIKRAYTHANLLEDNIRSEIVKELTEDDFDIKDGALLRYSGLSIEVIIPDGVTKISAQAFKKSKNCERVVIPDTVTDIESEAFAYCPAADIALPPMLKKVPSFAFYSGAVTDIALPDTVSEIEDNAFGECYMLESVRIPTECKKIGEAAFKNCTSLYDVEINEGTEVIGDYAFAGCVSLERIVIPNGCLEIGNFAFDGCKELKEVYLPDTIQFVGGRVFEGASHIGIYGKEGSFAEKFASDNRLRFVRTDIEPKYKKPTKAKRN